MSVLYLILRDSCEKDDCQTLLTQASLATNIKMGAVIVQIDDAHDINEWTLD